jgi:hypothetical protein
MGSQMAGHGRLAKRTASGLICRLSLIASVLLAIGLITALGHWIAGRTFDWSGHALVAAVLLVAYGGGQVLLEQQVDSVNALMRLIAASVVRFGIPLLVICLMEFWWRPGFVRTTVAFLVLAYLSELALTTWLAARVVREGEVTH